MGRRPRSRLDLALPNLTSKVEQKQQSQKNKYDQRARHRTLQLGDNVQIRNFSTGDGWLPGTIVKASGPLSFNVKWQDCTSSH